MSNKTESVMTATGLAKDMISGVGHTYILGRRVECKYAPSIYKSVISVGQLT